MTDPDFLRALEDGLLPPGEFGHAGHLRAAYLYLLQEDFPAALERTSRAIRKHATAQGKPGLYHATVTAAYVALIQQHICERGDGGGWAGFARDNGELFARDLLRRFYPDGQLDSALARKVFVLPRPTG
jgi:hypothetical protein